MIPYICFRFQNSSPVMRMVAVVFVIFWMTGAPASAQAVATGDEVSKGRHLAIMLCTECHLVAPDQPYAPTLSPPAPSFVSIAQRPSTTVDSLRNFLIKTHQGLDNPKGMPNPMLADFQIAAIAAYLLSLRK